MARTKWKPKKPRSVLGEESWFEIGHKLAASLATLGALAFGVWAYFNSIHPVFEKEKELETHKQAVVELERERTDLHKELDRVQLKLEKFQAEAAIHRRGVTASHLDAMGERTLRDYAQGSTEGGDFCEYAESAAAARLEELDREGLETPEQAKRAAVEFFQRYLRENCEPEENAGPNLADLLPAFFQQDRKPPR